MKKIKDQKQYSALLKILVSQDISSKDSIMKTVLFNKIINHLFLKLTEDQRQNMLEMLKMGVNESFLDFMNANLDEKDIDQILKSANVEYTQIFNQALISQTNGK